MIRVTAAEFDGNVDHYRSRAHSEPVEILFDGRSRLVLISGEEYARLSLASQHQEQIGDQSDLQLGSNGESLPSEEEMIARQEEWFAGLADRARHRTAGRPKTDSAELIRQVRDERFHQHNQARAFDC